jgi:hypothetical protein
MRYITEYLNRARYILRNEGTISLLRRTFSYLSSYIFLCDEYYVVQYFVGELNEADFLPRVEDFTFKLITSNEMADDWAKRIGFDFRGQALHARRRLDAEAVAFCTVVQNHLAHIGWVGLSQKAKDSINPQPYQVNFAEHQGCIGGAETASRYRNNGLMSYNWVHVNNYMKQQGITMLLSIEPTDNVAVCKVQSKFPSRICAKARYIKFLWWQYWRETPLPEGFKPPVVK